MIYSMVVQGVRWYITKNDANGHTSVSYLVNDNSMSELLPVPAELRDEFVLRILLAVMRSGEIREAQAIAGRTLRDRVVAEQLLSCRNSRDFTSCQATVQSLIDKPAYRFAQGKCPSNYVPRTTQPVMMDVIGALSDLTAAWMPFDEAAQPIVRISDKVVDDHNLFTPDYASNVEGVTDTLVPITSPVTSRRGTALSFQVKVPGKVSLNPRSAKRVGLPTEWPCFEHRRYPIAVDGRSLYDFIIVQLDDAASLRIHEYSDVLSYKPLGGGRFKITLPSMVIDNTKSTVSASDLYDVFRQFVNLDWQAKAISHHLKKFSDYERIQGRMKAMASTRPSMHSSVPRPIKKRRPSMDQIRVLQDHGVNVSNNYIGVARKVVAEVEAQPMYTASLSGMSKAPDIEKLLSHAVVSTRPSAVMILAAVELYEDCDVETLIMRQMNLRQIMATLKLRQFELMSRLIFNHAQVVGGLLESQTLDKILIAGPKNKNIKLTITLHNERIDTVRTDAQSIKEQMEFRI